MYAEEIKLGKNECVEIEREGLVTEGLAVTLQAE